MFRKICNICLEKFNNSEKTTGKTDIIPDNKNIVLYKLALLYDRWLVIKKDSDMVILMLKNQDEPKAIELNPPL